MLSSRRKYFSSLSEKIGKIMSFIGPNYWTMLSLILGILASYFISINNFLIGAIIFGFAALCDSIDGAVARHIKKSTKKGAYIDTITDRYVEFIIIIGLFFSYLPSFLIDSKIWLFFYLFGSMMTTYSKAAAKEKGLVKEEMKYGILERAERMSILFIAILIASVNPAYTTVLIALLSILSNITAIQRIKKALGE